jgi:hypothetical protein
MRNVNLDKNKRHFIFHPFLFSCLPILLLISFNAHETSIQGIFIPLIISVLLSFVFWLVLRRFLKGMNAGLILSWIILLILIHGNVSNLLELEDNQFNSNFILGAIFLIMGILGTIFFVKTKSKSELNSIFNVVAVTICVILVSIFMIYNFSQVVQEDIDLDFLEIPIIVNDIQKKPDVFVFVFDGFAGEKQLESDFNYDLKPFKTNLEKRGFVIPDLSFTNYPNTIFSIPSLLNMNYVDNIIEEYDSDSKDFRISNQMFKQNNVMNIFKSYGYKTTIFQNGAGEKYQVPADSPYVDEKLCMGYSSMIDSQILRTLVSIYLPIYSDTNIHQEFTGKSYPHQFDECIFSFIEDYEDNKEQPHFVFAHLMLPHGGYRYDSEGNYINPEEFKGLNKGEYLNQLIFTEKKSLEMIDSIQQQNPESVIILFSDHGFRDEITWGNPTDEDLLRGFNNISAVYFPDKEIEISEKLSLVNVFRIFFNEYFDTNYDILEDRHIWHHEDPFINEDVTNRLNSFIIK